MKTLLAGLIFLSSLFSFKSGEIANLEQVNSNSEFNSVLKESESSETSIMVLGSYSLNWLSYSYYMEGLSNVFGYSKCDITYEFMNTKEIDYTEDYASFLSEYYNDLYSVGQFDAIVVLDDDSLDFTMDNIDNSNSFLYNTPVFFAGVNDLDFANEARSRENVFGISEIFDYNTFIQNTISLLPNKSAINYITDSTSTGQGLAAAFESTISEIDYIEEVNVINTSELTYSQLTKTISEIPSDEATFYLAANFDAEGNYYSLTAQRSLVRDFAKGPVFSNNAPLDIDDNPYTGYIDYDYVTAAEEIATQLIAFVEEGKDLSNFEWNEEDLCGYVYDQDLMEYHDLEFDEVPENVTFINETKELFEYGSSAYLIAAIVSPLVIIFIAALVYLYFRNKRYNREMKDMIHLVKFNSEHDLLTQLREGELFEGDIKELIKKNDPFAVVVIDVDNMKDINSFYGCSFGDEVIKSVGKKVSSIKGFDFQGYRIGGDEVGLILQRKNEKTLSKFIETLDRISINKFLKKQSVFYISTTVGISLFPENLKEEQTSIDLIDKAYAAVRIGKNKGKKGIEIFDDSLILGKKNSEIYSMLIDAVNRDGFEVIYQPIVDIKSGEVAKYEALLRIKSNRLSPALFIPVAEDTGLIVRIGRIVIEKSASFVRKMNDLNVSRHVSTNFSFKQFSDKDFFDHYIKTAEKEGISIEDLDVELTENVLFKKSEEKYAFFDFFKKHNIPLSLDDFGTGYSSFNSLFSIPISNVKIDKGLSESLCENIESSKKLISYFHQAGLKVVMEGIETKEQVEAIKKIGADYIQGYYFSKPLSEEDTLENIHVNYKDKIN